MKTFIRFLLCVTIFMTSIGLSALPEKNDVEQDPLAIVDSKLLVVQSIGHQIKILDIQKTATEKFIEGRNSSLLKDSMERTAKTLGMFIGCSIICTFFITVTTRVAVLPSILLIAESVPSRFYYKSIELAGAVGRGFINVAITAAFVAPFVAGYLKYEENMTSTWSQQLSKLKNMTDAQVAMEYDSILNQGKLITIRLKSL